MIVGVDVSKDKLDIAILPSRKHREIKQAPSTIKAFFKKLEKPELVVFESTGGYEKLLIVVLLELEIPYHCAHPNRVHHFAKGRGYFAKTDRIDAFMLSEYGLQNHIKADEVDGKEQLKMKELSGRRSQLKEMISQEKNRKHGIYLDKEIKRSIERNIKQLEKELKKINEALEVMIKSSEVHESTRDLLQTISGVAHEVSTVLVTDLPELGSLTREQISNLVGLAPRTHDSGKKQGYRRIGKGRSAVRKALYMAALVASRYNPKMKARYEHLISKGKKPKVALVALMRKLVIIMNAMVKRNEPWQSCKI